VCESDVGIGYLSFAGFITELMVELDNLRDTRGAHGVTLRFEPATGVDGLLGADLGAPMFDGGASFAGLEEAEVLGGGYLGNSETIVDFSEVDILWLYTSHLVCLLGGILSTH
jgi:hypothetical protein